MQHGRALLLLAGAFHLLTSSLAMRGAAAAGDAGCWTDEFSEDKSYDNCTDLGNLGARLYWNYAAAAAKLSVAFVAPKPSSGVGWVAWAINPTGDGMKGAQALVGIKTNGNCGCPYHVRTYNITGYDQLPAEQTPIAFKATNLASDNSNGKVRLYGDLQLHPSMKVINHIWQVGSSVTDDGAPAQHEFKKENLAAKAKLELVPGVTEAPAPAPGSASSSVKAGSGNGSAPAPPGGKLWLAPLLTVLALASLWATV